MLLAPGLVSCTDDKLFIQPTMHTPHVCSCYWHVSTFVILCWRVMLYMSTFVCVPCTYMYMDWMWMGLHQPRGTGHLD